MIDGSQFGFVGMNMKRYRLGEICEIVSGSTPKTSIQEYWDGDIKWITPAEITDDSYIITDTVRKITKLGVEKNGLSSFPAGTVILSSRAPIGKVAIAGCDMYCNQGFKNLICSKIINNKYLYWFLKGKKDYLNKLGRGATFKEISKQIVAEIEIELPSLEEQVLVANNLLNIKRVIDLKKKEIDLFDKLIKARFV
ncbi:MAG: restriction endonuclease subunit S, partial [Clostridia bacterium]|nr:restriction endonuclease subunit S [Clostridia bacterium]